MIVCFLILLLIDYSRGSFIPDKNDYNAYGSKTALNDILLVQAQNDRTPPTFLIRFAPYENTETSLECLINFPNMTDNYIYSVGVGKRPMKNETYFFFIGELIHGQNGAFIGIVKYNNINDTNNESLLCKSSFSYYLQYFYNYEHQEHYILAVEPRGLIAYGFSNQFILIFNSRNTSTLESWNKNLTWPDASFIPHAVDISEKFGVIAGFVRRTNSAILQYDPIIYLINFNSTRHPIVTDEYKPIATPGTWQDLLTNSHANIYSAKHDMSISISDHGDVLVGMQFINRVFLFSVNIINPINLIYESRNTNGRSLGNGKAVAWLENGGLAAILVSSYTLNYQWLSSQVYLYDMTSSTYNSNSTPISVFPNNHQTLPTRLSSVILNIIASSSSLAVLDDRGHIVILIPTPAGYYLSVKDTGSTVLITSPEPCISGTYKNRSGITDCILCPRGTKNPGRFTTSCIPCSPGSFCSLGAADEVPESVLETTLQVLAYPKSPESTIFEEILLENVFSIRPGRCVLISPLFWTLIVASVGLIIVVINILLKFFIKHPKSKRIGKLLTRLFKHTDLINEGELWVGGLASFCIIVLVSFAHIFSHLYYKQYPIETSSDSSFACDLSLRNARFETSVQSLSVPHSHAEQEMFELMNNQEFILNVDFVNTLINCDAISIQMQLGKTWSTIRWLTCQNKNSILSLSIPLPYQHISVQILLEDIRTIGALRIGLAGDGHENENFTLKELNFYQSFSKNGQILAQTLPIALSITKVINETEPLADEESDFGGIFIPTFAVDLNSLFLSANQYIRNTLASTTVSIVLIETPYYIKNLQRPIVTRTEIIFNNLLFTLVCLELFGLIFVLFKLILKPLYDLFRRIISRRNSKKSIDAINKDGDIKSNVQLPTMDDHIEDVLTYSF